MKTKLESRAIEAAKKYLTRKNYVILDEKETGTYRLVAMDNDTICFIEISCYGLEKGFPEERFNRSKAEQEAALWLQSCDSDECIDKRVRFDSLALLILGESKAFLRHRLNMGVLEGA